MKGRTNDDFAVTPAALGALRDGDLGNALAAMLPGGIEAQEAAGQRTLVGGKNRLPIRGTTDDPAKRKQWEAVGFVFGNPIAEGRHQVFVEATFPPGWALKPTDHSMWSDVVDEKGRKRASVFFKAAFYDYIAHTFGLERRYVVDGEYAPKTYELIGYLIVDRATGKPLYALSPPAGTSYDGRDKYREEVQAQLAQLFPDHANPLAYWD